MTDTRNLPIQEAANASYQRFADEVGRKMRIANKADELAHWDWNESIRQEMMDDPLSLTIDEIDPHYDEVKWNLLLGTGGPAVRILVTTDLGGAIDHATYQYQDWFTPWTDADDQDPDLLRWYADIFYYGVVNVTLDGMDVP